MKHRLLSLLLALLALPVLASAECLDAAALDLIDAAVSAAVVSADEVLSFDEDETVPEAFAARILLALDQGGLENAKDRTAFLESLIAAPVPSLEKTDGISAPAFAGMEIAACEEDDDAVMVSGILYTVGSDGIVRFLDVYVDVTLRRDASSPMGWKLHRFAAGEKPQKDFIAGAYYVQTMAEYVNTDSGFSILFPDIFPDDCFVDEESGISAALAEGDVSFFVHREKNEKKQTLDALLAEQKKENPSLETNMDELTGCARTRCLTEDGLVETNFYLVSESSIYHAQFVCPAEAERDYALYLMYMMNSFTADELGLG